MKHCQSIAKAFPQHPSYRKTLWNTSWWKTSIFFCHINWGKNIPINLWLIIKCNGTISYYIITYYIISYYIVFIILYIPVVIITEDVHLMTYNLSADSIVWFFFACCARGWTTIYFPCCAIWRIKKYLKSKECYWWWYLNNTKGE